MWRSSLQLRTITSASLASAAVVLVAGVALINVVVQRFGDQKLEAAGTEIDRSRDLVVSQIAATDPASSVQTRLDSARSVLASRNSSGLGSIGATFEPVLVVNNPNGSVVTSPEGFKIPAELRTMVGQSQVAYQFDTLYRNDGTNYKALIVGSPTDSDIPGLQVYMVMPLDSDDANINLLRGLLFIAGAVQIALLVSISWFLTRQVSVPVRSASRIAQRFAAGHLRERMPVEGVDELGRLAMSFNSMADSLSKQIKQLEEYGDLQRQFTSDVSHELRTPLTTVRMAADMIADQSEELDAYTKRAVQLMVRELDRFETLLADLLEISRHDAGMADLASEAADMRHVIDSAWQQSRTLAETLGVKVNFHLPEQPVMVEVDSRRIERILRNLVNNAVDHAEGRPVDVTLAANAEACAITVVDHGVGLKPGQEELVFNRFWRADPSRVRHSGGTGLGLAIAREDAVLHGGTLDAIGQPGIGSMFRLVLPRIPNKPYEEEPLALAAPEPLPEQIAALQQGES